MLTFRRHVHEGSDLVSLDVARLVIAGWAGRDARAVARHIEELAALGVPRPPGVPVFYRVSAGNLTQSHHLQVLGDATSGEVEPILIATANGLWLGIGSDHTDRAMETSSVAAAKQICGKVVGSDLWRLADVEAHWDRIAMRSFVTIEGERILYQDGTLAELRPPADLLARHGGITAGTLLFCGTIGAIGGIRPADRFEMELRDPVLGRTMRHAYDIDVLPEND